MNILSYMVNKIKIWTYKKYRKTMAGLPWIRMWKTSYSKTTHYNIANTNCLKPRIQDCVGPNIGNTILNLTRDDNMGAVQM